MNEENIFSLQRPTARELQKHPFIRRAKRNVILTELIERCRAWKEQVRLAGGSESETEEAADGEQE